MQNMRGPEPAKMKTAGRLISMMMGLILSFFHDKFEEGNVKVLGMTPDILLLWITVGLAIIAMIVYAVQAVRTIRKNEKAGS